MMGRFQETDVIQAVKRRQDLIAQVLLQFVLVFVQMESWFQKNLVRTTT